ncbi:MAG: tRNA guanosine(15) transglycosylase TgtA [Promethearchaeota archaeon]
MKYEILDIDALGRVGKLEINNKQMITPTIFPVVHPFKNIVPPSTLKKIGAQCIFTNAYIIYQKEELKEEVKNKKIHNFLGYNELIATDSGAFQQYMYHDSELNVSPEEIERFQEDIGSDFPVILDLPVQLYDEYNVAKHKVLGTIERAKNNIKRRTTTRCEWFGPIHGAHYHDLLKYSAEEMSKLDFGIYAIGGLVKAFLDYRFDLTIKILLNVKKHIISNKPLHMFGLGLPQFFSLAVACGCDLMDSAAYILYAKENRYFTLSTGTKQLDELEEFPCYCPICLEYTPKELKSLDKKLKIELLAKHNLYLSFSELRTIRQAIREGNLWELVEQRIRAHPNLVKAAKILKDENLLFETYEKIYKKHGRLLTAPESSYRPLIMRFLIRLENYYRVPNTVTFLLILPELDARIESSPTLQEWMEKLDKNNIVSREEIHILFSSQSFGLIPFELINTYPMGQYESILPSNNEDIIFNKTIKTSMSFLNNNSEHYQKVGMVIPKSYTNQFGENEPFLTSKFIQRLNSVLKNKFKSNFQISHSLEEILQFFKGD